MKHEELTKRIIGAYYEVYNHTSRTYPEYIYERAMMHELQLRGLPYTQQDEYEITYKDWIVGKQRLDLFVVQEVVVENKVSDKLTKRHKAQGISYLKTVDKPVGLLFNFGSSEPVFIVSTSISTNARKMSAIHSTNLMIIGYILTSHTASSAHYTKFTIFSAQVSSIVSTPMLATES